MTYLDLIRGNDILEVGGREPGKKVCPRKNYVTLDINPESNADVIGDAQALPFPDDSFDTVLGIALLEHLHSPHVFVEELKRVLRPGGLAIVTAPFIHPYHGGNNMGTYCPDYYRFTHEGLQHLFREFDIEIKSDGGFFHALGYFFVRLKSLLFWLDRFYPNGSSRHLYTVYATKP